MFRVRLVTILVFVSTILFRVECAASDQERCDSPCSPFGLFFKVNTPTAVFSKIRIPILFDTTAFSSKNLILNKPSGSIKLKKQGYWILHYSLLVGSVEAAFTAPVDIFVHTSDGGDIVGSGRPTIISPFLSKSLSGSIIIKACTDCTDVSLYILNPLERNLFLFRTLNISEGSQYAVLDALYLGPLSCVCGEKQYRFKQE